MDDFVWVMIEFKTIKLNWTDLMFAAVEILIKIANTIICHKC